MIEPRLQFVCRVDIDTRHIFFVRGSAMSSSGVCAEDEPKQKQGTINNLTAVPTATEQKQRTRDHVEKTPRPQVVGVFGQQRNAAVET